MYYNMAQPGADGWILPLIPFHFTLVQNIKRDPFEQSVGTFQQSAMSIGGSLGGPLTAYQYDWNMLPIGQQLWLKELLSYEEFPPMQAPETWNLDQVLQQVKAAGEVTSTRATNRLTPIVPMPRCLCRLFGQRGILGDASSFVEASHR
jgi:hypothetical protein